MAERFAGWSDGKPQSDTGDTSGATEAFVESGSVDGETSSAGNEDILTIVDPGSASGSAPSASSASGPRPRRKYTKRANKSGPKTVSEALVGIEEALIGLHYTLAQFTQCSELQLEQDEAAAISKAVHNVAAEYDYENLPKVTKQTFAWGNLAVILFALYGGRAIDIANRKSQRPAPFRPRSTEPTHLHLAE